MFSFFKFDTIFGNAYLGLNVVLLDDSCDHIGSDVLVLESGINFIESIRNDGAEFLSSGHECGEALMLIKFVFYESTLINLAYK